MVSRLYILAVYAVFLLAGTLLARRSARSAADSEPAGVWRKYPSYIGFNLLALVLIWLPQSWPVFPLALVGLGLWIERELWPVLRRIPGRGGDVTRLGACLLYVPACLLAILALWRADDSGNLAAFLYLTVAANDAFAQIVGERAGRRPLARRISPAKTVEGAFGGLAAAGLIGATLGPALGWPLWQAGALGLACGGAALGGDLLASAGKRAAGVATYGRLLGPHGGVMDRVDGLLLAGLVLAGLTRWP